MRQTNTIHDRRECFSAHRPKPGLGLTWCQFAWLLLIGAAGWTFFIPFIVLVYRATISFTR